MNRHSPMMWVSVLIDEEDYWKLVELDGGPAHLGDMTLYGTGGYELSSVMVHDVSLENPRRGLPK